MQNQVAEGNRTLVARVSLRAAGRQPSSSRDSAHPVRQPQQRPSTPSAARQLAPKTRRAILMPRDLGPSHLRRTTGTVGSSMNTAWSHAMDEVYGSHTLPIELPRPWLTEHPGLIDAVDGLVRQRCVGRRTSGCAALEERRPREECAGTRQQTSSRSPAGTTRRSKTAPCDCRAGGPRRPSMHQSLGPPNASSAWHSRHRRFAQPGPTPRTW